MKFKPVSENMPKWCVITDGRSIWYGTRGPKNWFIGPGFVIPHEYITGYMEIPDPTNSENWEIVKKSTTNRVKITNKSLIDWFGKCGTIVEQGAFASLIQMDCDETVSGPRSFDNTSFEPFKEFAMLQRVKVVNPASDKFGKYGVICNAGQTNSVVKMDGDAENYMFNNASLEPLFEIGDRVKINAPGDLYHGMSGVIADIDYKNETVMFRPVMRQYAAFAYPYALIELIK